MGEQDEAGVLGEQGLPVRMVSRLSWVRVRGVSRVGAQVSSVSQLGCVRVRRLEQGEPGALGEQGGHAGEQGAPAELGEGTRVSWVSVRWVNKVGELAELGEGARGEQSKLGAGGEHGGCASEQGGPAGV